MDANLCVHCEQPIALGQHHAFAYPKSGYLAHAACISVVNYEAMDERLTRYHARSRVARITPEPPA